MEREREREREKERKRERERERDFLQCLTRFTCGASSSRSCCIVARMRDENAMLWGGEEGFGERMLALTESSTYLSLIDLREKKLKRRPKPNQEQMSIT
jgi:hypothetical protein